MHLSCTQTISRQILWLAWHLIQMLTLATYILASCLGRFWQTKFKLIFLILHMDQYICGSRNSISLANSRLHRLAYALQHTHMSRAMNLAEIMAPIFFLKNNCLVYWFGFHGSYVLCAQEGEGGLTTLSFKQQRVLKFNDMVFK